MTDEYQKDPIEDLFEQAIQEGYLEDVRDRWTHVIKLYTSVLCSPETVNSPHVPGLGFIIFTAMTEVDKQRTTCDLTPTEYQRLSFALENLNTQLIEFCNSMRPLFKKTVPKDSTVRRTLCGEWDDSDGQDLFGCSPN